MDRKMIQAFKEIKFTNNKCTTTKRDIAQETLTRMRMTEIKKNKKIQKEKWMIRKKKTLFKRKLQKSQQFVEKMKRYLGIQSSQPMITLYIKIQLINQIMLQICQ